MHCWEPPGKHHTEFLNGRYRTGGAIQVQPDVDLRLSEINIEEDDISILTTDTLSPRTA